MLDIVIDGVEVFCQCAHLMLGVHFPDLQEGVVDLGIEEFGKAIKEFSFAVNWTGKIAIKGRLKFQLQLLHGCQGENLRDDPYIPHNLGVPDLQSGPQMLGLNVRSKAWQMLFDLYNLVDSGIEFVAQLIKVVDHLNSNLLNRLKSTGINLEP